MKGIGGNIIGTIQIRSTSKNAIGEQVESWNPAITLKGWLDLQSGDSKTTSFNAKIQESTHIFLCDYCDLPSGVVPERSRMVINGNRYDVTLIDNPMNIGAGSHYEIYLKFTGGQQQ